MRKLIAIGLIALLASCSKYDKNYHHAKIETEYGNIVVKLYNSTPNHTNNFVKLTKEKFYDGIIFHRVIKDFVIQGGDPETKKSETGKIYGEKDSGYLIDAEFVDTIIHKRGVIAMARESDDVNPEKKSSGSQFYIVIGKVFTDEQLDSIEIKQYNKKINNFERKTFDEITIQLGDTQDYPKLVKKINELVKVKVDSFKQANNFTKFNENQRKTYTTIGGIPHLDGNYTIFGEVIEGFNIVEKISLIATDENDRPIKDIKMKISLIN